MCHSKSTSESIDLKLHIVLKGEGCRVNSLLVLLTNRRTEGKQLFPSLSAPGADVRTVQAGAAKPVRALGFN